MALFWLFLSKLQEVERLIKESEEETEEKSPKKESSIDDKDAEDKCDVRPKATFAKFSDQKVLLEPLEQCLELMEEISKVDFTVWL